jgi:hypothetical protein
MEPQDLGGSQPVRKAEELGEIAERRARRRGVGGMSAHERRPASRPYESTADLDEGRLARAVGAEQPDELRLLDDEVDVVQRVRGAISLDESASLERRSHAAV